jgi:hypothetical protein
MPRKVRGLLVISGTTKCWPVGCQAVGSGATTNAERLHWLTVALDYAAQKVTRTRQYRQDRKQSTGKPQIDNSQMDNCRFVPSGGLLAFPKALFALAVEGSRNGRISAIWWSRKLAPSKAANT